MTTYPRLFRVFRDDSIFTNATLGHVADGVEWTPGGKVTLDWLRPGESVETFPRMQALYRKYPQETPYAGAKESGLRVEYVKESPKLDQRLVDAFDEVQDKLFNFVDSVQKKVHVDRNELQKSVGKMQDLIAENSTRMYMTLNFADD